jgi:hypothetical protein
MHKVSVAKFRMGDIEDPEVWINDSVLDWQQSQIGQWVMSNSKTLPCLEKKWDTNQFNWLVDIIAEFDDKIYTEYLLRWS